MKKSLLTLLFVASFLLEGVQAQQILDITRQEVRLLQRVKDLSPEQRDKILADSLYRPYKSIWDGYLGSEADFAKWASGKAFEGLAAFFEKLEPLGLNKLEGVLEQTSERMARFTGFVPQGKWLLLYGPGWCNICGGTDGSMVIDLASSANASVEDIASWLPHEINHQIYGNQNPAKEQTVIRRVVDEGLACYASYLYYHRKRPIATELAYTEEEYQTCVKHETEIVRLIGDTYNSSDAGQIVKFGNRKFKFKDNYPGAIGYFIGFRIVEEYVKKFGEGSWKEIYALPASTVFEKSGLLKQ